MLLFVHVIVDVYVCAFVSLLFVHVSVHVNMCGLCVCLCFVYIRACVRVYRWRASVVVFQGHVRVSAYFRSCVHQCVSV
jgi:hypothetical protein